MISKEEAERLTQEDVAGQADALGKLAYEALSSWCLRASGNEIDQQDYAENIGFGVKGFCQSIAMQIRGSFPPEKKGE